MENNIFNLSEIFEKLVCERLENYMCASNDYDTVLKLVCRDFPYMDKALVDKCADAAYRRYFGLKDDVKTIAGVKDVLIAHSNHLDDPIYSHLSTKFHLLAEEDLFVVVVVENPFYLSDNFDINMSFRINGQNVNEFKHSMCLKERRNVYYIPLNIGQIGELASDGVHDITVEAIDENVLGQKHTMYCTVYRGDISATDAFEQCGVNICDDCGNDGNDMLEVERIDSIRVHANLNYNGGYGNMPAVEAVVKIKPSCSIDIREGLIIPICLNEQPKGSGLFYGSKTLFNVPLVYKYNDEPIYNLQPGKYCIEFYIWDTLIWRSEVEFNSLKQ